MHQWLFDSFVTDHIPHLAMRWAQDDLLTARLLGSNSLPGAVNLRVVSQQQTTEVAQRLGYQVIVKPVSSSW